MPSNFTLLVTLTGVVYALSFAFMLLNEMLIAGIFCLIGYSLIAVSWVLIVKDA